MRLIGERDFTASATWLRGFWRALMSLQCKTTVLVVVLTLTVTAAVSGYLLQSGFRLARDYHDYQMVQLSSLAARAASFLLAEEDLPALRELAEEVATQSPLLYVVFTDVDGKELAAGEQRGSGMLELLRSGRFPQASTPGTPVHYPGADKTPPFVDISYPLQSTARTKDKSGDPPSTKLLGYVRAGMSVDEWERSMSSTLDLVIGVGIIATVVAIPLGFLLVRRIISPLEEVSGAMLRFSEGKLNVRSPVRRSDEIGRLGKVFNRMAEEHQRTHERLVRLNVELEDRVARRTAQLRELASREPLTGLYNRRHFNEVLERSFAESLRYDKDLSCIMMDLDDFKDINDTFGHHTGDELLVLAATIIVSQLRTSDVAARFGGDEFIVLLPQTGADSARVLGERIVEKFAADAARELPGTCVSASMGVASLRALGVEDSTSLVQSADRALYAAKAAGKNRIVIAQKPLAPVTT